MQAWEPTAGDFVDSGVVHQSFLLMQKLYNNGAHLIASIWDVPNWMAAPNGPRVIPRALWPQVIEGIAQFLVTARDTYGVTVDDLSFNEPNGCVYVCFSSTDYADFIAQAGQRFDQLTLHPKWLVGDTYFANTFVGYATPILQNAQAAPYLGPFSFHSWDNPGTSVLRPIVDLAHQYHRSVICPEVGIEGGAWADVPSPFPTWSYAWSLAQNYYNILKYGEATMALYWQYQNRLVAE